MKIAIAAAVVLLAVPAVAQQHKHGHSPYAGLPRDVKALSEQQIADLRAGRGMGLALAAELNGYPGPLHVLELADRLQLTGDEGRSHSGGERLIAGERALDQEFADRKVTPARLALLTAQIGEKQGELRAVHLKYHLTTADLLTADQRQRYAELRGYR